MAAPRRCQIIDWPIIPRPEPRTAPPRPDPLILALTAVLTALTLPAAITAAALGALSPERPSK